MKKAISTLLALAFMACAKPKPELIIPVSEALATPLEYGCTCSALTEEQMTHIMIIGDLFLSEISQALGQCQILQERSTSSLESPLSATQ